MAVGGPPIESPNPDAGADGAAVDAAHERDAGADASVKEGALDGNPALGD